MFHLCLKSNTFIHLCGACRPQNGIHTTTVKGFVALKEADQCKKCEAMLKKMKPGIELA